MPKYFIILLKRRYGIYPLTAFALSQPPPAKTRAVTPEGTNESAKSITPEPNEPEQRWGLDFRCYIGPPHPHDAKAIVIQSKLCDTNYRQMSSMIQDSDVPEALAEDLFHHSAINWRDVIPMAKLFTYAFIQRANEIAEYEAKVAAGKVKRPPKELLTDEKGEEKEGQREKKQ